MKKFLSLVLVLVLALGSFSYAAPSDVVGTDFEDAVSKLMGVGVLTGYPDGTFKPAATITRAEYAAIAVRLLGLESAASYAKGATKFSDVPSTHWASGYVNIAVDQGIINGYPNGTFGPSNNVTYAEAITMLVRVLGYAPEVDEKGTWPSNYIAKASLLGVTDDVNFVGSVPANRGDIALFADNSLSIAMMIRTGFGDEATYKVADPKMTLLADKIKATAVEGKVLETLAVNADITKDVKIGGTTYDLAKGVAYDFDSVLGQDVKAWTKDGKIVAVEKKNTVVKTVLISDLALTATSFKAIDPADPTTTKTYYFAGKTSSAYNTTGAATYVVQNTSEVLKVQSFSDAAATLDAKDIVELFLNDDGYVVGFHTPNYLSAKKVIGVTGTTIEIDGPDVKLAGQVYNFDLTTLVKDDYFFYYRIDTNVEDANEDPIYKYTIMERKAAVTDTYNKLSANGRSVTLGTTIYPIAMLDELGTKVEFILDTKFSGLIGKLVKVTFAANGMIDTVENKDTAADSNFAVLLDAGVTAGAYGAQTVNVKLVNTANKVVELVLKSDAVITGPGATAQGKLDVQTITSAANTVHIISGAATTVLAKAATGFAAVVEYKLNTDGKITELTVYNAASGTPLSSTYNTTTKMLGGSRITADTLVYSDTDEEFFALKDLQADITYTGAYKNLADTTISEGEFVFLTNGAVADASKYAFFKDQATIADAFEVRLFVDGELKTFVTKDNTSSYDVKTIVGNVKTLVKVDLSTGKISAATNVTTVTGALALAEINKDARVLVLTGSAAQYDYEADVVVVTLDADGVYGVGSLDNITDNENNTYKVYNTDSDTRIEYILVIKP